MKPLVKDLVEIFRKRKPTYDELANALREARLECGIVPPKRKKTQKPLLKLEDMRKYFKLVDGCDATTRLMMRFFLFMGLRLSEVANLKVKNIDMTLGHELIYVERKRKENLDFCIPAVMVDLLRVYMEVNPNNVYLFEHTYHNCYTDRGISMKMSRLREKAGIEFLHPHAFRHRLVSFLDGEGWDDRDISKITGHVIPGNITVYARRNVEGIRSRYNEAMKKYAELVLGV